MTDNTLTFKCADPSDLKTACDFYRLLCDQQQHDAYTPLWRYGLYPDEKLIKEAIDQGEIYLGFLNGETVAVFRLMDHVENMSFHLFGIHPDYRRQGLSNQAMEYLESVVKAKGRHKIVLDVVIGNLPAEKLYLNHGFVYTHDSSLYEVDRTIYFHNFEKIIE